MIFLGNKIISTSSVLDVFVMKLLRVSPKQKAMSRYAGSVKNSLAVSMKKLILYSQISHCICSKIV